MSKDFSKAETEKKKTWGPAAAIIWTVLLYAIPQIVGGLIVSIYPALKHWGSDKSNSWLTNDIGAQFVYTIIAESMSIGIVWLLLKHYRSAWRAIGLMWPKAKDALYALSGFGAYFAVYITLVAIASALIPSFNINQQQDVGFQNTTNALQLFMAFISLVVLPPIAEEIIFRGFLFKGLRNQWSFKVATLVTSVMFAAPHLIEGVGGLLWVGALDTFVLSIVLCYLRERTGSLIPGMGVHALKNGIAFVMLFVLHTH
jgi:uncharacterized protein